LQALSVTYADSPIIRTRQIALDCLKLIVVSLPVIALTLLAVHGLNKLQSHLTLATTLRYLLIAVVAPMLVIQLWIAATNGGLRSLAKRLHRIRVPTLIVWGDEDRVIPPSYAERFAGAIAATATVRRIASAGHLVAVDRPDELAAAIDDFLRA